VKYLRKTVAAVDKAWYTTLLGFRLNVVGELHVSSVADDKSPVIQRQCGHHILMCVNLNDIQSIRAISVHSLPGREEKRNM
jgi:hypothetical protein